MIFTLCAYSSQFKSRFSTITMYLAVIVIHYIVQVSICLLGTSFVCHFYLLFICKTCLWCVRHPHGQYHFGQCVIGLFGSAWRAQVQWRFSTNTMYLAVLYSIFSMIDFTTTSCYIFCYFNIFCIIDDEFTSITLFGFPEV